MIIGATILIAGFIAGFLIGRKHRKPETDKYAEYKSPNGLLRPFIKKDIDERD